MKTVVSEIVNKPIGSTIHCFEAAGLGIAPFKYRRYYVKSGSCDFCGTAIVNNFEVISADSKVFKVGCDCIEKSGDVGLRKVVSSIKSAIAKQKREDKKKRDILVWELLKENNKAILQGLPHPHIWCANQGKTAWDYFSNNYYFNFKNGIKRLKEFAANNNLTLA